MVLGGLVVVWVEVVEVAGLDAGGFDEGVDVGLFEAYDSAEPVGRDPSFVDESVQRPGRHAETPGNALSG